VPESVVLPEKLHALSRTINRVSFHAAASLIQFSCSALTLAVDALTI
jgi:hypothetical protein